MTASFAIGWRQVALSFILLAAVAMIATSYSILAVPLAEEFQPSRMVLMLSMTVLARWCWLATATSSLAVAVRHPATALRLPAFTT